MPQALIAHEDATTVSVLSKMAQCESYEATVVDSAVGAIRQSETRAPDLVFISHAMIAAGMAEWFDDIVQSTSCDVIVIGTVSSPAEMVDIFRRGITDFLLMPIDRARARYLLRRCIVRLAEGGASGQSRAPRQSGCRSVTRKVGSSPLLIGESSVMHTLRHQISRVAPTDASVLLLGESGTGKELIAHRIHDHSDRCRETFLPVNCGAISPQLIESEIFGHEKGSFTGADRQHKGYFERACGGSLFLDEVIEMPVDLQVKLLRVLETGTFMRLGSHQELKTNVRIIAATNRDPESAIAEGRLRLDLYHRLNVFPVKIPPLRDRGSDIELIAQHLLDELNSLHGTHKFLSAATQASLKHYHWPGNVRELGNFVQRAYILADQSIDVLVPEPNVASKGTTSFTLAIPIGSSLADVDRKLIVATLELCGGAKKRAADLLGISLKTLYNRLEEYGHRGDHCALTDHSKTVNTSNASPRMPGHDSSVFN